jgi:hypothetical protein
MIIFFPRTIFPGAPRFFLTWEKSENIFSADISRKNVRPAEVKDVFTGAGQAGSPALREEEKP